MESAHEKKPKARKLSSILRDLQAIDQEITERNTKRDELLVELKGQMDIGQRLFVTDAKWDEKTKDYRSLLLIAIRAQDGSIALERVQSAD